MSQQIIVNLSDIVSINLSKEAEKLNKEQLIAFAGNKYDIQLIKLNPKNVFKLDGMLLSFFEAQSNFQETHINDVKNELDGVYKHARADGAHYKSFLKTINGNKVLITKTVNNGIGEYSFYSMSNNNKSVLNGSVQFDINDEEKAIATLDAILESIKFLK